MRYALAFVLILVLVACMIACSTYDESKASASVADASTTDASTSDSSGSANDAGDAPPAGLLANGGFESSTGTTCAPNWSPLNSVMTVDTTARTGSRSCKVCNNGSGNDFGVAAALPFQPGQWVLSGHVRPVPGAVTATEARVEIAFSLANEDYAGGLGSNSVLGGDWTPAQTSATSSDPAIAIVNFQIGGIGPNGACVLVDDVSAEHF